MVSWVRNQFKEYTECRIISDHFLNMGPLGGIPPALLDTTKEAIFVFTGDMPMLDREIIASLLEDNLKMNMEHAVREFLKNADVQYMQMDNSEKAKIAFTNINSPRDLPPVKS